MSSKQIHNGNRVPGQRRHIIGRLTRVLYSWDTEAPWHSRLRLRRTMMKVGREDVGQ